MGGIDTARIEGGKQIERLVHFDFLRKIGCLQADADAVLERADLDARVIAEHLHVAGGAWAQAFQNLHCSGFPGPVGSQQAEDLTGVDLEIDTAHRFDCAVVLAQALNHDGRTILRLHTRTHGSGKCAEDARARRRTADRRRRMTKEGGVCPVGEPFTAARIPGSPTQGKR